MAKTCEHEFVDVGSSGKPSYECKKCGVDALDTIAKVETNKEARERHQRDMDVLYAQYGTSALLMMIVKARNKARDHYQEEFQVQEPVTNVQTDLVKAFDRTTKKLEEFAFKGGIVEI